jgi:hypothetical protein
LEGLAFVIQSQADDALGPAKAGLGYGDTVSSKRALHGISNSVAVEFDTHKDEELGDPNDNHVSVHTNGHSPNSASERSSIATVTALPWLYQGVQNFTVEYLPMDESDNDCKAGCLRVTSSAVSGPVLVVRNKRLEDMIDLADGGTTAWLGFTASTGQSGGQFHDILSWDYEFLGKPTPRNYVLGGTGLRNAVAGTTGFITMQVRDQFRYDYPFPGINVSAAFGPSADGGDAPPAANISVAYDADGIYLVNYTLCRAGKQQLNISDDGVPVNVSGRAISVDVAPAPVDAASTRFDYGDLGDSVTAGDMVTVNVVASDVYGNQQRSGGAKISFTMQATGTSVNGTMADNRDGSYKATFAPTVTGNYTFSATLNGLAAPGASRSLVILPADPSPDSTLLNGTGTTDGVAGENSTMVLTLRDTYDNRVPNPDPATKVTLSMRPSSSTPSASPCDTHVRPSTQGTYLLDYTCTQKGKYLLTASVNSSPIAGSPRTVTIHPGDAINGSACIVDGSGFAAQYPARLSSTVTLTTVDFYGNTKGDPTPGLEKEIALFDHGVNRIPIDVSYGSAGQYSLTFNTTRAHVYIFDVLVYGKNTSDGSHRVTVDHAELNAATSPAAPPDSIETDRRVEFVVTAQDAFRNKIGVGGATAAAGMVDKDDATRVVSVRCTDEGTGEYTCSLKAEHSGTYSLEITLNDEAVEGSPFTVLVEWGGLGNGVVLAIGGSVVGALVLGVAAFFYMRRKRRAQFYTL